MIASAALAAALWLAAAPPEKVPLYFDQELTAQDLEGLSLRELDLVRNTIFARQGHTFRKKWLRDYFAAQPWYHPVAARDEPRPGARDLKNAAFVASFADAIPAQDISDKMDDLLEKRPRTPEDQIELELAARALGLPQPSPPTPLDDPSLLDGLIKPASLQDLSRRDLRVLRNLIYARRGRPFQSPLLREHFGRMKWYQPDPAYTDARLTKVDRRNVKLVMDAEIKAGGAVNDEEMAIMEGA